MDIATQQILSGLAASEPHSSEGASSGGLATFGNKVKEYWDKLKTEPSSQGGGYGESNEIRELMTEKESLDPAFKHAARLLEQEISRLSSPDQRMIPLLGGGGGGGGRGREDGMIKTSEKIYIPPDDQKRYNLVGRLLGPKGLTLKRMQAETQTKMTILGRGSIRDKKKEEELRTGGDPMHAHLNDDLHIVIEVIGPFNEYKLMAGVAEVRKMLIPAEEGMADPMGMKYLSPEEQEMYAPIIQGSPRRGGGGGGLLGRGGGGGEGGSWVEGEEDSWGEGEGGEGG